MSLANIKGRWTAITRLTDKHHGLMMRAEMDGQMYGRYQMHYLPTSRSYAVDYYAPYPSWFVRKSIVSLKQLKLGWETENYTMH